MTCLDEISTFGLEIACIGAPVYFWIFSAWTGMRFQARQCVQPRSARRAGVPRHNCQIQTLYFHFETPRKFGRRSLKNAGGFSTGMEHRAIAAKLRYVISEVNMSYTTIRYVIYQVYAWYILMEKSIYLVYTQYIPCINLSYDDIQYIPDIHVLKTFSDILVPVTLRYGHSIYLV